MFCWITLIFDQNSNNYYYKRKSFYCQYVSIEACNLFDFIFWNHFCHILPVGLLQCHYEGKWHFLSPFFSTEHKIWRVLSDSAWRYLIVFKCFPKDFFRSWMLLFQTSVNLRRKRKAVELLSFILKFPHFMSNLILKWKVVDFLFNLRNQLLVFEVKI